jgi:hypothetical protein
MLLSLVVVLVEDIMVEEAVVPVDTELAHIQ